MRFSSDETEEAEKERGDKIEQCRKKGGDLSRVPRVMGQGRLHSDEGKLSNPGRPIPKKDIPTLKDVSCTFVK